LCRKPSSFDSSSTLLSPPCARLPLVDFADLLTEQASRSDTLISLPIVKLQPGEKPTPIRTQARAATVLPNFVGLRFQIYNGKVYHDVTITENMVGHKLGEFSPYVSCP
jgi:ribosomal protein S19